MYGGAGNILGFVLTVVFCRTVLEFMRLNDLEIYGSAVAAGYVFGALGRYIARRRNGAV
jgi:hypothetical protein